MNVIVHQKELDELNNAMQLQISKLRRNANVVLKRAVTSLAKNLIQYTPPLGTGIAARRLVEHHVENDVNRAVTVVKDIKNQALKKSLNHYAKRRDYVKATEVMQKVTKQSKWKVVPFSQELHEEARSRTPIYEVKKNGYILTLDGIQQRKYTRSMIQKAGSLKSAWVPFISKIQEIYGTNVSLPSWVKRQNELAAYTIATGQKGNNPSFEVETTAPTMALAEKQLRTAIKYATNSLMRDLEFLTKNK